VFALGNEQIHIRTWQLKESPKRSRNSSKGKEQNRKRRREEGREREDGAGSGADTINLHGAERPYLPPAGRGRAPGGGHQA